MLLRWTKLPYNILKLKLNSIVASAHVHLNHFGMRSDFTDLWSVKFGILKQFQFFWLKSWQEVNWWHHFQFVMTSSNICHWSVNYTSVMWPSQTRCQSSFHNGYPRYKFQVYKVSRSWDTIGERVCVYNPFHTASYYSRGRCTLDLLSNLLL